ncbi:MAG: carboxypeptidase-like regulatory domain-containing protein, partial [Edaphobacter sp.]
MIKKVLLLCFLSVGSMSAQVDSGTITGTLHDSSGAAIADAQVTLIEKSTNTTTIAPVDKQGNYVSPPLRVGVYSVVAEAPGFQSQTRADVTLQVQDRRRIDFTMSIGQVSQNVTITDTAPAIQTDTSALGQVITSKTITALPLNGRDYVQLATLSPGVVSTKTGTNGNTGGSSTGGQSSFAANGARGTMNNFLLDGIDNNSNDTGGFILRTSVDAIQEFKIQTNSFSAQFGRSGGATINATIKSGTNAYHGSVFEFFRNSALDARDYFEDPTSRKASFKQNMFGATIGGPILRDKLFWFGDYQGTVIRNPTTWISSVPTAAQRIGDFSGTGNPIIYDPSTYDSATNTRTPFPGNIIPNGGPGNRVDPLALAIMNLYPLPNQPGKLKNNYLTTPVADDRIDQGDFRGDYNMSDSNHLFFRWSMSGRTAFNPPPLPGLAGGGGGATGFGFEDTMGASFGVTHTFTPRTVNEFRLGFNHVAIRRGVPLNGNAEPPANLLVPGVPLNPQTSGITLFTPSGYRRVGSPGYAPTILSSQERQITNVVNMVRGKHTLA